VLRITPMPRALRPVFALLATLAVWLVASPAFAAAPMCDDRGASGMAPAPTLDTPNASVDIGMNPDTCSLHVERDASYHEGRAPQPLPSPHGADLLPADHAVTLHVLPSGSTARESAVDAARSGIPSRLERPPRLDG
jgi:hypothetical protein